jgi:hypothetical protein
LIGTPQNAKATADYKKKIAGLPAAKQKKVNQEKNMNDAFKPRKGTSD